MNGNNRLEELAPTLHGDNDDDAQNDEDNNDRGRLAELAPAFHGVGVTTGK